jgi:excisionase family DNA binding protein
MSDNLTIKEVASRLRLSPGSVYTMVHGGKLRHTRVGLRRGRILVPEDAVHEYLAEGQPAPAREAPTPRAAGFKRLGV